MKNVFSAKVEIIIFLFSQNRKCYTSKFSKKVENNRGRNLKMHLFPRIGKKCSYFLYFYIYLF